MLQISDLFRLGIRPSHHKLRSTVRSPAIGSVSSGDAACGQAIAGDQDPKLRGKTIIDIRLAWPAHSACFWLFDMTPFSEKCFQFGNGRGGLSQ